EDGARSARSDLDPDDSRRRIHVLTGGHARLRSLSQFLKPRRIGTQIALMVVASLLLSHGITTATFLLTPPPNFEHPFGATTARLVAAARLIDGATTPEQRQAAIEVVRRSFPEVKMLGERPPPDRFLFEGRMIRGLQRDAGEEFTAFEARPDDPSRHGPLQ